MTTDSGILHFIGHTVQLIFYLVCFPAFYLKSFWHVFGHCIRRLRKGSELAKRPGPGVVHCLRSLHYELCVGRKRSPLHPEVARSFWHLLYGGSGPSAAQSNVELAEGRRGGGGGEAQGEEEGIAPLRTLTWQVAEKYVELAHCLNNQKLIWPFALDMMPCRRRWSV